MIRRYGIDTSILVRLMTFEPFDAYKYCIETLTEVVRSTDHAVYASNQVIGEAYIVVQLHYGATKIEAKKALTDVFESGIVLPLSGPQIMDYLTDTGGAGLVDRLIANGYANAGLETLTLDRKMANLHDARIL